MVYQVAIVPNQLSTVETQTVLGEIQGLVAALQIQVSKHFAPFWQIDGSLAAYEDITKAPIGYWPIMIKDVINDPNDLGYHLDDQNQPYAVVQYQADGSWTQTVSHELLEMLADPWGNKLLAGPSIDPNAPNDQVRYLVEVCDPVEASDYSYTINGIVVSDFITPAYHNPPGSAATQYDYMGYIKQPRQVLSNGYLTWEDLSDGKIHQINVDSDGNPSFSIVGTGTFPGTTSLRSSVNQNTPEPGRFYDPTRGVASVAAYRRAGVQRAAAARAQSLLKLIK